MRKVTLLFLTVIIIVSAAALGRSQTYDVLITSGDIYDGSGRPSYIADVGIKDGYIAAIGQLQPDADTVIDAQGLAVAPGFINMLSWANESLIEDGRSQSDIRQGVTLEVMGEGWSMGPLNEKMKRDMRESQGDITSSG
jgi:N-acyl-D-amino-acid deacylase